MINFIGLNSRSANFLSISKRFKKSSRGLSGMLLLAGMSAAYAAPFAYLGSSKLESVAVVDMATYTTIKTLPLVPLGGGIPEIVANDATGKVYVATQSSVKVIDSVTQTITGQIQLSLGATDRVKAMVVSPDGDKAYVLTVTGKLTVIDTVSKSVITTLILGSSALAIAIDTTGQKIYVATRNAAAKPAITIIDGELDRIEKVVPTGTFFAGSLSVNPANDRLYMITEDFSATIEDRTSYQVFDPVSSVITRVVVPPIYTQSHIFSFTSLAFNKDGSRLYLGTLNGPTTTDPTIKLPVLEVDSKSGAVTQVLLIPNGYADEHTAIKLVPSFANNKFVLAVFLKEHLHHYNAEPARRAVFVDVASNTVLKDLTFTPYGDSDMLIGDILDPSASVGVVRTTTTLQANTNPPLRRNIPVNFTARVTGKNPTGKVSFELISSKKDDDSFERVSETLQSNMITFSVALQHNIATLAVPACNGKWENRDFRKIVCSNAFTIVAKYKGNAHNLKSNSEVLQETR